MNIRPFISVAFLTVLLAGTLYGSKSEGYMPSFSTALIETSTSPECLRLQATAYYMYHSNNETGKNVPGISITNNCTQSVVISEMFTAPQKKPNLQPVQAIEVGFMVRVNDGYEKRRAIFSKEKTHCTEPSLAWLSFFIKKPDAVNCINEIQMPVKQEVVMPMPWGTRFSLTGHSEGKEKEISFTLAVKGTMINPNDPKD